MTKLTMEQLIKAANELDELMGLDLLPPVEDEDQEALETWIKDASEELHGDDTVSDETETVLEELDVWIAPEDRVDKEDEDEKGTKDVADDGGGQDLSAEVDAAESLKELREIVKANDEFKSLRGLMTKYKAGSEEDLKEEMLDLLEPDANLEPKEEKKPETKRKTPSGRDEVPIPKKGEAKMEVVVEELKIDRHPLNIMPEINKEDRKILLTEIQENGYDPQLPIILFEEKILDGWQRYLVCQELEIEPIFESFTGNMIEAMQFMLRTNKRRNLTSSQRAAIASQADGILNDLQQDAKEKLKTKGKKSKQESEPVHVDKEVAKIYQTNPEYVRKARKLQKEDPEEFEKVKSGQKSLSKTEKTETSDRPFFNSMQVLSSSLIIKLEKYIKKPLKPRTKTEISDFQKLKTDLSELAEINESL